MATKSLFGVSSFALQDHEGAPEYSDTAPRKDRFYDLQESSLGEGQASFIMNHW